jgi:hypothetical protein
MKPNEINEVLIAAAVFFSILIIGLALIHYWTNMEKKRIEKEYHDRWPSAKKRIDGLSQKELDRLLDYDDSETFYHK